MNKRPSTQFYPGDWWRAVDLRKCCMVTQGCWFNMLLVMWDEKSQGKIAGTKAEICRVVGCSLVELRRFFDDNKKHHFADVTKCNKNVTIINRRMYAAYIEREATKGRVGKHRAKKKRNCNANVTPPSSSSTSSSNTYTLTQVKDAGFLAGVSDEQAEVWYSHFKAQGFVFGNGQAITNLPAALARWRNNQYKFERKSNAGTNRNNRSAGGNNAKPEPYIR